MRDKVEFLQQHLGTSRQVHRVCFPSQPVTHDEFTFSTFRQARKTMIAQKMLSVRKLTTMNSMNPQPTRQDLPTHLGDVFRSSFPHFQIVVLDRFQQVPQLLRDDRLRERRSTFECGESLDRHDSRYDGDRDTGISESSTPVDEN